MHFGVARATHASHPQEKIFMADREGVVKMGDSSNVPRVAGHGTCQEGGGVVNEVGDNCFHEFLWEPGDW
jgi:hypothetical protein